MAYDELVPGGSASKIIDVMLRDLTGQGKTGLAHGDVTASYVREGGTRQAITLIAGSPGDVYSSGKWAEVDATNCPGLYQLHIPDAALAAGASAVTVYLLATGVINDRLRILLLAADLRNGDSMGLAYLTGDAFGRLGAPSGASVSADIATVLRRVLGEWMHNIVTGQHDLLAADRSVDKTMLPAAAIAITGANWTDASKTLTKVGAFADYVWRAGDLIALTAGTGVIVAQYAIASRTSDDAIVLSTDINGAAGNISDNSIAGAIVSDWLLIKVT